MASPAVEVTAAMLVTVTVPLPATTPALMPVDPDTVPVGATVMLPLVVALVLWALMPMKPAVTLPVPVTVTPPVPAVVALTPVAAAMTVPVRSTSTLPALLAPPIAAVMPTPPVAFVVPVPPTWTPALVPATLLFCPTRIALPAATTLPLPSTVTAPVPELKAKMPVPLALTLALAVTPRVPALAALLMRASIPLPPTGVPPPIAPAMVTLTLPAVPLEIYQNSAAVRVDGCGRSSAHGDPADAGRRGVDALAGGVDCALAVDGHQTVDAGRPDGGAVRGRDGAGRRGDRTGADVGDVQAIAAGA